MIDTGALLEGARDLYAAAPSHAPNGKLPEEGCYCAMTAIYYSTLDSDLIPFDRLIAEDDAIRWVQVAVGRDDIVDWNAESTTEEVLAAFDAAIEASRVE